MEKTMNENNVEVISTEELETVVETSDNVEPQVEDKSEVSKPQETSKDFKLDVEKEKKNARIRDIIKKTLIYTFLTICAILAFLPFYWMIISSLKSETEYRNSIPTFFPHSIQWNNYSYALQSNRGIFGQMLLNTIVVGLVSTIIGVVVTILTAYAFARINFKGKNILFAAMLATMMIPGEMFTITNYITVSKFGWSNTYVALILPFLVSIYYVYLLRNAFMQIPNSLYQAAKVDGVSDMGYLVKVMVPLTAPTLISITLLKFIGTWNSYIWPRLINKLDKWRLITNWVTGGFTLPGSSEAATTIKMAAAFMVSLPLFILFICFRKYIMHGVSKSGTKG